MNIIIIWLVVGGLLGWVAGLIMSTDAQQGIVLNIIVGGLLGWVAGFTMSTHVRQGIVLNVVVGIVGALLGGWLLSPLFDESSINQANFSFLGLMVSLMGAVALLTIVNLFRREAAL